MPQVLRIKPGAEPITKKDWESMTQFIASREWLLPVPVLAEDQQDPLTAILPTYGAFMLGFDFHLTHNGPKLIEINTNAGGLSTLIALTDNAQARQKLIDDFLNAIKNEWSLFSSSQPLPVIAIVDDDVATQPFFPEMQFFAKVLTEAGYEACTCSPEELFFSADGLTFNGKKIDLIYNRLTDFRLTEARHKSIRNAVLSGQVALTPHPAVYARSADKRRMVGWQHPVIPETHLLSERSLEVWQAERKQWVFKPPTGAGSRGVYRGDKITIGKLSSLPPDTIVQKIVAPSVAADGSKMDVRVYTSGTKIIGAVSRQYTGQVMEMASEKSGFKAVVIEA
jgi:hypothetical protein